jgi:F0F1-type ATP synthase membrane subunit b/b'
MAVALLTLLPVALAAVAGEGGIPSWVPKTLNIAIFAGLLYFLLRKPVASFFEARSAAIKADLERAKRERAAAEAKLAEVEARLARLSDEQERIRTEAEAEVEAEQARVRARTDEEVRRIAEAAEREVAGALKAARADLQRFVAEQSVHLAENIIRSEMSEDDRKRIVGQYAEQMGEVRK